MNVSIVVKSTLSSLSVVEHYNIDNIDNECSSFFHNDIIDVKTYISKYLDFLLE